MFLWITLLHVPVGNLAILAESVPISRRFPIGQSCGRASQQTPITLRFHSFTYLRLTPVWIMMNEVSVSSVYNSISSRHKPGSNPYMTSDQLPTICKKRYPHLSTILFPDSWSHPLYEMTTVIFRWSFYFHFWLYPFSTSQPKLTFKKADQIMRAPALGVLTHFTALRSKPAILVTAHLALQHLICVPFLIPQ